MELTKKNVIEWLNTKESGDIVGEAGKYESCPLAMFIKENKANIETVIVTTFNFKYQKKNGRKTWKKELPLWAKNFVARIDDFTIGGDDLITVDEALDIINDI